MSCVFAVFVIFLPRTLLLLENRNPSVLLSAQAVGSVVLVSLVWWRVAWNSGALSLCGHLFSCEGSCCSRDPHDTIAFITRSCFHKLCCNQSALLRHRKSLWNKCYDKCFFVLSWKFPWKCVILKGTVDPKIKSVIYSFLTLKKILKFQLFLFILRFSFINNRIFWFVSQGSCGSLKSLKFTLSNLKGYSTPKWKFCRFSLTPMSFQTRKSFVSLQNSVVKSTDRDTIRYWNFKNVHFLLRFERCWADY